MRAYQVAARNGVERGEILVFAETAKVALAAARLRIRRDTWRATAGVGGSGALPDRLRLLPGRAPADGA